jgi:phosphoserine aminotransferase
MTRADVINLAAGPSPLPDEVLEEAARGLLDYQGSGMGICEISHRSKTFETILNEANADLRELLSVPDDFAIVWMQGGGVTQFGMTALNMVSAYRLKHPAASPQDLAPANYIVTGSWSAMAVTEAKRCGVDVHIVTDSRTLSSDKKSFGALADPSDWNWSSKKPAYIYYCSNETVNGVEIDPPTVPEHLQDVPVVCDMSSNILSRPIPWSSCNFGLIYAGAQKNIGPPGVTIAFVRRDLLVDTDAAVANGGPRIPAMLSYKMLADNNSLYNTPPTFSIYVSGLVFKHIKQRGGLDAMTELNAQKADLLYAAIEASEGFYVAKANKGVRSRMNVVFVLKGGEEVEGRFIKEADKAGIKQIKGHRFVLARCRYTLSCWMTAPLEAFAHPCTMRSSWSRCRSWSTLCGTFRSASNEQMQCGRRL